MRDRGDRGGPFDEGERRMTSTVVKAKLRDILSFRALFLQESNFQIRYDACHERGWTDSYLLMIDGVPVGYGSIKGQEIKDRDTVFEFFVIPSFRKMSSSLFRELLVTSGAPLIECQSNDLPLASLLFEFATAISSDTVLLGDHVATRRVIPGASVRRRTKADRPFEHSVEPVGDYVLDVNGEIVATAGFLLHYNMPFADLYMEVREDCRGRGFASFLLQEVKKECYLAGRVPAARCGLGNAASRGALINAGLRVSGFMLKGEASRLRHTES